MEIFNKYFHHVLIIDKIEIKEESVNSKVEGIFSLKSWYL